MNTAPGFNKYLRIGLLVLRQGLILATLFMWFDTRAQTTAPIQITWLANTPQSPHAVAGPIQQWYSSRIGAWAKQHPDVKLEVEYLDTDINLGMTKLQGRIAAGRAPDVASIDSFFLPRFFGELQPLDPYVRDADDFMPFARRGMHGPDRKLKALWVNTDVRALFYRKDLVATPPKTWDDLLALAPSLRKNGVIPYIFPGGRGEASLMDHLPMLWTQGGRLISADGEPVFGEGTNREALIQILSFLRNTVVSGASPVRVVGFRFEADMYPDILRGNVAMFLGGSWIPKQLRDLGDKAEWSMAAIPMRSATGPSTVAGGWTYGVFTPDPAKQRLIVDFVNFIAASPDGMIGAVSAQGNLPTRISVADSEAPYLQMAITRAAVAMLPAARARDNAAIYPTVSANLQVAIADVITGQESPKAAIDHAFQDVRRQVAK
jgi:multiple sugar transport system substrate-binding protein